MEYTGPIYCETFLHASGVFPFEPVNTWTSLIPVLFGLLALWWLYRQPRVDYLAYVLAGLAVMTGVGSVLWHGLRTELTLTFDVLPGLMYFLLITLLWPQRLLLSQWWGFATVAALLTLTIGLSYLLPDANPNGPPIILFFTTAALAFSLLAVTFSRNRTAFWWATGMLVAALMAATARTIDLSFCDTLPFGTHFIWHCCLGFAAYAGVRLVSVLRA